VQRLVLLEQASRKEAETMRKTTIRQGVLALALLGGAALIAGPAVANSFDAEGDFGGRYNIGPGSPERWDYERHHVFRPHYGGPAYAYGYPDYYGYYGPGIAIYGPGVEIY
jgi:hypothetical protein